MASHHANAVNLARRLYARNEPDFLQDSFCDDGEKDDDTYSKPDCGKLAETLKHSFQLPTECLQQKDVLLVLQRKNSQSDHAVAFQGMSPGEAQAAMAARDRGKLHHAQIQRRFTHRDKQW
mmetsp:Transcript_26126/g.38680  ORF Transcript_26126/g.38680 Transcript_26126/m.38680 type:complete len:121 (+) Transcript_26126:46-408(+)|eukprot:CAMPEP_0195529228 /NCGR_PEP_ID=MMETSP0794_2-20130614/31690_1 /TAXON_ID=515487 /ORGANISM="Stephanopyxis turris, Strain CCMP 815" /LENGTH=120 /DNA_ID=CAMNT_0040660501 /DNA_START=45 /DNA_END=407 /DNA_ORIENTATION=+